MDFLRRHQTVILWGVLAFFVLSIALGFGSSFFVKGSPNDAVATVDGHTITIREFTIHYNRALAQIKPGTVMDKPAYQQKQQEVLRDLIQMYVFQKQSEAYGIRVPDAQVINSIAGIPQFHNDKGVFDPQQYVRFLQYQAKTTPSDFEEEQRQSIAFFKLRYLINSSVKVTDAEARQSFLERGAAFAKTNAYEMSADGKKKRLRAPDEIMTMFRTQLIEEKSLWALNQWFSQIGAKLHVKPYLERLQVEGS
jgi:hypothetical protein